MAAAAGFVAGAVAWTYYVRSKTTTKNGDTGGNPYLSGGKTLRIGTRKSDLAMVQTRYVVSLLKEKFPDMKIEILKPKEAAGDKDQVNTLASLAAKNPGLFTSDLENGLQADIYDCCVHSLKDMPTTLPDKLILASITEREDPRDVLVVHEKHKGKGGLKALPVGSIIGTCSVRREAFLGRDFDKFGVKMIRGNVNTRLRKLDDGEYDAIMLASAGLKRLGPEFAARIEEYLEPPHFLYGVGQGSLGLECREGDKDTIEVLQAIEHFESSSRCKAERALLRIMEAGCQVPLGVHTEVSNNVLSLACTVLSLDGKTSIHASMCGDASKPEELGRKLAAKVKADGGKELLDSMKLEGVESPSTRPLTYGSAESPHVEARPPANK